MPILGKRKSGPGALLERSLSRDSLDGSVIDVLPADYYGHPVDDQGLLVTINLCEDICQASSHATGMTTEVYELMT